jgi:hypothetical protein
MHEQVRRWIVDILKSHHPLLAIAFRQRAKFEGWLKFELAAYAEENGALSVCVEASPEEQAVASRCRSDLSFRLDDVRYDIELKTPNSNWCLPGVGISTRPITKNIAEIVVDARKLSAWTDHGLVAFVLFPIPRGDVRWHEYLERISMSLETPLSAAEHTTQVPVRLAESQYADAVVCCFTPRRTAPATTAEPAPQDG